MSQVVTWAIALLALVVSVATYRLNVRDRRRAWEAQERAQAEEVAGWLIREMCEEHKEVEWKAYVRNSSRSPVYDVLYVIHDSQDLDTALPEMIPLIPPDTTWDFFPTWFGAQPEENLRVYMTFRDKRGKAWQRDTHGRLAPFRRNVDDAPPADPVSGRISYGITNQAAGMGSSVAATKEEVADALEEAAEHRSPSDAVRLGHEAESVRQHAATERGLSNQPSNDHGRQRRTPADERGPGAAAQGEDAKA
jgi:hypothetical protein